MLPAGIVIPYLASREACDNVPGTLPLLFWSKFLAALNIGSSTRKMVFLG
jgi:hypothetical protein